MLELFDFYYFFSKEDFFLAITIYSFMKYIVACSYLELIWPTQFFNRRNVITSNVVRNRTYTEVLLKTLNANTFLIIFYTQLLSLKVLKN